MRNKVDAFQLNKNPKFCITKYFHLSVSGETGQELSHTQAKLFKETVKGKSLGW